MARLYYVINSINVTIKSPFKIPCARTLIPDSGRGAEGIGKGLQRAGFAYELRHITNASRAAAAAAAAGPQWLMFGSRQQPWPQSQSESQYESRSWSKPSRNVSPSNPKKDNTHKSMGLTLSTAFGQARPGRRPDHSQSYRARRLHLPHRPRRGRWVVARREAS